MDTTRKRLCIGQDYTFGSHAFQNRLQTACKMCIIINSGITTKRQTHREVGTQSHGSAGKIDADRQTAELFSAFFLFGGAKEKT